MSKKQTIYELAKETQERITTPVEWMHFLETQAWHYKQFSFPSQLLIYAQRPETKACATFDEWNRYGRHVKRNSKGIALIDESNNQLELNYIFAVEDTHGQPVHLWQMEDAYLSSTKESLRTVYQMEAEEEGEEHPEQFILQLSRHIIEENLEESFQQLAAVLDRCPNLSAFTEDEIRGRFQGLIQYSVAYTVLKRLEVETTDALFLSRFLDIANFKDLYALTALGETQHRLSKELLKEIEHHVKGYYKHRETQREENFYEHPLSESERIPDSRTNAGERNADYEIRDAQKRVSERSEAGLVSGNASGGNSYDASVENRSGGESTLSGDDAESFAEQPGTGENRGESGLDEAYGDIIPGRGRNRSDGSDLSLNTIPEEILEYAFLQLDREDSGIRPNIAKEIRNGISDLALAQMLNLHYPSVRYSFEYPDGKEGSVTRKPSAILSDTVIDFQYDGITQSFDWPALVPLVRRLDEEGRYLDEAQEQKLEELFAIDLEARKRGERYTRFQEVLTENGFQMGPKSSAERYLRAYIYENSDTGRNFLFNALKNIVASKEETEKNRAIELLSELDINTSFLPDEELLTSASDSNFEVTFPTEEEQMERLSETQNGPEFSQETIDFILKTAMQNKSKQDVYLYFQDNPSRDDGIDYVQHAFSGNERDLLLPDGESIHIAKGQNGLFLSDGEKTCLLSFEAIQTRIRNLISYGVYLSNEERSALMTAASRTYNQKIEEGATITFGGSDYTILQANEKDVILQDQLFPIFTNRMNRQTLEQILKQQSIISESLHIMAPEDGPIDAFLAPDLSELSPKAAEQHKQEVLERTPSAAISTYCYFILDRGSKERFTYPKPENNKPIAIIDYHSSAFDENVGLWVEGYVIYPNPLTEEEIAAYGLYPYDMKIIGEDEKEYRLHFTSDDTGITVLNNHHDSFEVLCHIANDDSIAYMANSLPDAIQKTLDRYIKEVSRQKNHTQAIEQTAALPAGKLYRYYSHTRPIGPGGFPDNPENKPVQIINFNSREWVPEYGGYAWGYVEYPAPLSETASLDYELTFVPRPISGIDGTEYQLGFEKNRNGIGVYNKLERKNGSDDTSDFLAYIKPNGEIQYYQDHLPNEVITQIQSEALNMVPKKKKTAENRNYDWLKRYAPEIVDGTYDYLRFENPDSDSGYMPLYIEKIGPDEIAMAHYTFQNGDMILDPEVTFHIDHEKAELTPLSFEMSGILYQRVYAYNDTDYKNPDLRVKKDIQSFLNTWKNNILEQDRVRSLAQKDGISFVFLNGIAQQVDTSDPTIVNETPVENAAKNRFVSNEQEIFENLLDLFDMYQPNDPDFLASATDVAQTIHRLGTLQYEEANPDKNRAAIADLSEFLLEWAPDLIDQQERQQFDTVLDSAIAYLKASEQEVIFQEPTLFDFTYEDNVKAEIPYAEPQIVQDRINYRNHSESIHYGGPKVRFRNNVEAIQLLHTLENENRLASPAEMDILSRYVGWGGLSMAFDASNSSWQEEYQELKELLTDEEYRLAKESTLTAFYTPVEVMDAIFETIGKMGFQKGNILDPACGIGSFFGSVPDEMQKARLYGIEKDSLSGRIAKQLYQNSNIQISGYETASLPDSFFDLAIGNVPFGNFRLHDKRYDKQNFMIHDYFLAKTLDKVRPGGIICFITSKETMDKTNPEIRTYIAERADLLGAVRLPNNTFKQNAGTEVTSDILFLKKREKPRVGEADWIHLEETHDGIPINSYFIEHPEMILGQMVKGTGYGGREIFECVTDKDFDLKQALSGALAHIEGEYQENTFMDYDAEVEEERVLLEASPDVKNFSFTLVDGDIYFRENSQMYQVKTNATALGRIKGLIALRTIVYELIDAQLYDRSEGEIQMLQQKLSEEYDRFTNQFGIINSRANELAFSQDSSYFLLCSLEHVNDKGEFISKADIFYKRTIGKSEDITHCDSPIEALMVSISEKGRVDFLYMQDLLDNQFSFEEIQDQLKGHIFRDPELSGDDFHCYVPADEYLSGNVRKKLRLAEEAAREEPALYEENVKQLEEVLPEWIEAADITAKLGATWIPDTDIDAFFKHLLKINPHYWYGKEQQIHYSEFTNSWLVENKSIYNNELGSVTYGTKRRNAAELLEQALNLKTPEIYDEVYDAQNDRYKRVKNVEETIRAIEKLEIIQKAFDDWIWQDPERRERLATIYNERFNCIRNREFNGEGLRFHGISPSITLKPHQKDAIARIILGGNTMLAHCVGAGKTYEMVSAAMEMKAMGLSNKNMIVVPNHLIKQFAAEALQLYPAANILGATKRDFEPRNRKKFCSRIATGDYDMVIIGHSQFEKIPLSAERQKQTIEAEIEDIVNEIAVAKQEDNQRFTIKDMERTKKSLEAKLEKLNDQSRKDDVITFEQLGVDRLFIDEAHNYKNLFIKTKMNRVAGLSTASAQKSMDLFLKCRYMDEKTGNRGNIHATGTPVSNSLVELYTTQRYLQYDLLMDLGLHHFDSWASNFTEQKTVMELAPEGNGYRMKTRLAKFHNIPELMALYKECADIKTQDMLHLDVPVAHFETVVTKPTDFQLEYVQDLGKRAEKIRAGMVDSREDNMLLITNDGRKLALDQRLINPNAIYEEESKIGSCADKIFEIYQKTDSFKGTQLVFCDLSTPSTTISMKQNADDVYEMDDAFADVYHELKKLLMERGIPEHEIRFIHEANTELQKENMFEKVRNGEIRVLMGSTQKMGAGTNVQTRLYAIHDLDAPWRPSDLEQRAGRIIRQGNQNEDVYIYRYITENTFDAYLFQLLENKQWFCSQIMTSKSPIRVAEDIDEITISFAELKALAAGNPLIKERTELDIELNRLRSLKSDFLKEKHAQESRIHTYYPMKIAAAKQKLTGIQKDMEQFKAQEEIPDEETGYPLVLVDSCYDKKHYKELSEVIESIFRGIPAGERISIGRYRGFQLEGEKIFNSSTFPDRLYLTGEVSYQLHDGKMSSLFARMNAVLEKYMEEACQEQKSRLSNLEDELQNAIDQVHTPFHREEELSRKEARLKELDDLLSLEEDIPQEESAEHTNPLHTDLKKKRLNDMIADSQDVRGQIKNQNDNTYAFYQK